MVELRRWPMVGFHGENGLDYKGWTTVTRELGHHPQHIGGEDFRDIRSRGRIPIVRLNNGYGSQGTIPLPGRYRDFAQRCANFVHASQGAEIWIIGNEPNHSQERPVGKAILPADYARCYDLCREAIHSLSGHEEDLVLLAAIGPWNPETRYPGNEQGDWLIYFKDVQRAAADVDGFALHVYAREQSPAGVRRRVLMQPPFADHHWAFGVMDDWMDSILPEYDQCPCFVTECNAYDPWRDERTGFMSQAVQEFWTWNGLHPDRGQFHCVTFYRWKTDRWTIQDKPRLIEDFGDAVENGLVVPDYEEAPPGPPPESWVIQVQIDAVSTHGHRQSWRGEFREV